MKAIQEGLGGIRDVLLNGTQEIHAANYDDAFRAMRRARGRNSFINASPRLVLETVGVVALAGLTYGFSHRESGVADMLPVIAAVVFAAQRLIPTAHQLYSSWAALTGNRADILDALELLEQPIPPTAGREEPTPLALESEVRLDAVTFRYDPEGPAVLDGMGFVVQRGWRVGLVGATGSGKSTALDVLMGLLEPEDGQVVVDGRGVGSGERRAWQRSISHVPQFIYLADTSISENIALGIPEALVDEEALRSAADKAQILDFIEGLDEGFRTPIGERGVRLSGGQRQRIGLARAFYRRSDLLVLDEATSALDNETERAVVESLESEGDLTMVVVAHRLSTIRRCDRIYEIDGGRVIAAGTYDELLSQSPSFQAMAASPDRSEGGATQRSGEEAGP